MTVQIKTTAELEDNTADDMPADATAGIEGEQTVEGDLDSVEENEWDELNTEFEGEGGEEETVSQDGEPADQEEEVDGEAEEETTAESEEVPTEEVLATTETEAEEPVVLEGEEETTPTMTAEEYQAQVQAAREQAAAELVSKFQLTEDQADALVTDPNTVLPNLLADMYLDLFSNVMQGLHSQLPNMIQGVVKSTEQVERQQNAFYTAWPQLNKAEHHATVKRIGESYAALNPQATQEDFIREVGAQAWVAARLPIGELVAMTQGEAAPAEQPETSHSPANPGSATRAGTAPARQEENEFSLLADELLEDDS